MALIVVSFAEYLTRGERDQGHWAAFKFIRAIKGEGFSGYAWVPVPGHRPQKLTPETAPRAKLWFAKMAAAHLETRRAQGKLPAELGFVPIPSSRTTIKSRTPFTAMELAQALAKQYGPGGRVDDVLRWTKPMTQAHRGGSRSPKRLYEHLATIAPINAEYVVMVDDVFTTGAHLQAAAKRLRERGAKVLGGLCAGRTVLEPGEDAFAVAGVRVEEWGVG